MRLAGRRGGGVSTTKGLPRIAIIGAGGTITTDGRHSLDLVEYPDLGRRLEIDELLARFEEPSVAAKLVPVRFRAVGSTAIGPKDWLELNDLIHRLASEREPPHGVVITHGTATLEETAYFLNLTLKVEIPVVLVGAQRPPNSLGTDAGMNLLNAVRLAADPQARGLGVLVLLNDEIQAAREVTKTSTYRLETFRTPDLGMLGYADADGRIAIYRAPTRRRAPNTDFDVRGQEALPRVDIAYSYAGSDGALILALIAVGAEGIVCAALAPGLVTPGELAAQQEARTVTADNLNPQKARILAMLGLTRTRDPETIQRYFEEY